MFIKMYNIIIIYFYKIYIIIFELVENIFSESYVYFYFKCDINYSFHLLSCIYYI